MMGSKDARIVGSFLQELRVKAGFTQRKLAGKLGHQQTWVSKYETGARCVGLLDLRDICQVLGVPFVVTVNRIETVLDAEASKRGRDA